MGEVRRYCGGLSSGVADTPDRGWRLDEVKRGEKEEGHCPEESARSHDCAEIMHRVPNNSGCSRGRARSARNALVRAFPGPAPRQFRRSGTAGTDPNHADNVGVWQCWMRNIPLFYFYGLMPGKYLTTWPGFIRGDDPRGLQFSVAVDEQPG